MCYNKEGDIMQVRNCIRCGKLFNYIGKPICYECIQQDERF